MNTSVLPKSAAAFGRVGTALLPMLVALAGLALIGPARAVADTVGGGWLSPATNNWPVIAIHAALTPDGRVLTYGTRQSGQQTAYFVYDIWDPEQGLAAGHLTLDNLTQTDIFCSSQIVLPSSGSVFIAGGDNWTGTGTTNTGNNNTNEFSPADNTLARGNNMNRARWYSSSTALMSGEIYVQGGSSGQDRPEVRQLDGTFRLLSAVDTSALAALYPRNFLAPDGRVFGYDTNGNMYYVNPAGTGQLQRVGQFSSSYAGWTSGAAMYRPGKILQMGGNSNGAVVIDINGAQPVVTPQPPMSSKRMWVSATTLADGRVVATGGSGVENQLNDVNTSAEIWDPATGQWTVGPSGLKARLYHSTALLLPDATVLVAGGGAPGPLVNLHAEIYYPPYLYDASGAFAPRPVITTAPDAVDSGQTFSMTVQPGTSVGRVTMVKTGSVTHSVNMDQRFIELPYTESSGTVFATLPERVTDTPPGYYMVFVFDDRGVPSRAKIVRVNIPANPVIRLDYTSTIGGGGGAPFVLSCNSDETLVGVYGQSAGTYVNRIGATCVAIDQAGRWIGDPVQRGQTGTSAGTDYLRTCPRDTAISGFRGRSDQYVNQLDFECKALTPAGGVTGAGQYLGAVGGSGGNAQGPFDCTTGNPAYAMTGRSGGWIDAFGLSCRAAPITNTHTNTAPLVTNPGNQVGSVGTPVSLAIQAVDPDQDALTYAATGLPEGLTLSQAGVVTGTPVAAGTHAVSVSVSDPEATTTVGFTWTIAEPDPLELDPMPAAAPVTVNTPVTYTATTRNGINTQYKWLFGDGSETGWSSEASVTHAFASPTLYWVTVIARDDRGTELVQNFLQMVHLALAAGRAASSGSIAIVDGRLWVVNPDADTVSVFDSGSLAKLAEVPVGNGPKAVAVSPANQAWVTNQRSGTITVVDGTSHAVAGSVSLPYGSAPYGIVFGPDGTPYVALEASGLIARLNGVSGAVLATASVGDHARHLAISSDGARLYVSRFITPPLPGEATGSIATPVDAGGEVRVLDAATLAPVATVVLRHDDDPDFENSGGGVPNYLGAPVISPDGTSAWVPSKKDNVKRGTLRSGANLNHQNTVRAIASRVDLASNAESYGNRVDFDNASMASALAFDPTGVFMFAALETSREVAVVDAYKGAELFRFGVGRAPQGLAVSPDGTRLYVSNFMDRTVESRDLTRLREHGQFEAPVVATASTVAVEKLSPDVFRGKQLFYDARDARLAREGYMSCASCHNDGGGDGRTWDLTGMGEGLRNTISLRGHAGMAQGFLHWSANFDEVQDFEGQIRQLAGGTGLMPDGDFLAGTRNQPLGDAKAGLSPDLDALAAYVASLDSFDASPFRATDGTLTAAGVAGRAVFDARNCQQCHGGSNFSGSGNATLVDIGTIKSPTSGSRLGGPLTGIDPPTLRGLWATAPYLHDGSAATIEAAVQTHRDVTIDATDLSALAAYLRQIDDREPAPAVPPPPPVDTVAPTKVGSLTVAKVNGLPKLTWTASTDKVGVAGYRVHRSSNGTFGPAIATVTGALSWTDTTVTERVKYTYAVVAFDAAGNSSARSVLRSVTPGAAPTTPTGLTATAATGGVQLAWGGSTDNIGVVGYIVYRATKTGTLGPEIARITTGTTWTDASAVPGKRYTYAVKAYDAANYVSGRSNFATATAK